MGFPPYTRDLTIYEKTGKSKWRKIMTFENSVLSITEAIEKSLVGTSPWIIRQKSSGDLLSDARYWYRCTNGAIVRVDLTNGRYRS